MVALCAALSACGGGSAGAGGSSQSPATRSLSATVSGLAVSGLVLTVNQSQVPVASGATSVVLAAALPSGTGYAVAVASQPSGQNCSVVDGTGVIGTANVPNVVVICSDQTYTVGGSLAGLGSGSGLVLANGSDSLPVSPGATSFTLPAAVPFGSPYAVTVQTQPAGETCTVANAAGSMPAASVTNVTVSCSTNTYRIGGTISGLTASGLTLLDNGTDATNIPADAVQFSMTTAVAYGGSYDITIAKPPAGEVCSIGGAAGGPVAGNVTSVTVTCKAWSGFTASVLHAFSGTVDGGAPHSGLIQGSDGSFYGVTSTGGTGNAGTVFKITPSGAFTVLHSFAGSTDGGAPYGGLVQGSDGNFYGTTSTGGAGHLGTIFRITPAGVFTLLHSFTGSLDGGVPYGALVQGSNGYFYGTTTTGGTGNCGTIFSISAAGSFAKLHDLTGSTDGSSPYGALIQASDGLLYRTATGAGPGNLGTIFKVDPLTGALTVLHAFSGSSDGGVPYGALVQGSDGNFYGTTSTGGSNNGGTVFMMTPAGGFLVLHNLNGSPDGNSPYGALIQASDGNFYGTANRGGTGNLGTVFQITPSGAFAVIHAFSGVTEGGMPYGALLQGSDGILYGTTSGGGSGNGGTIYELAPQ